MAKIKLNKSVPTFENSSDKGTKKLIEGVPQSIINKFTILEEIGSEGSEGSQGACGKVYKAQNKETKEKVAIKLFSPKKETVGNIYTILKDRFSREIRFNKEISHPNIARLIGFPDRDKNKIHLTKYMIFEYAECDLAHFSKKKNLSTVEIIDIIIDILRGLHYLHQRGIFHRDIKPQNILMFGKVAKIADLGFAKLDEVADTLVNDLTSADTLIGTLDYMPPEGLSQDQAKALNSKSDLYSVGALFYELICKRPLFKRNSTLDLTNAIRYTEPDFKDFPEPKLANIIKSLLNKVKEERPECKEVIKSLQLIKNTIYDQVVDKNNQTQILPIKDKVSLKNSDVKSLSTNKEKIKTVIDALQEIHDTIINPDPIPIPNPDQNSVICASIYVKNCSSKDIVSEAKLSAGNSTLFVYTGNQLVLGRENRETATRLMQHDVILPHKGISMFHCHIILDDEKAILVNNSTNDIKVDDDCVYQFSPVVLNGKQTISFTCLCGKTLSIETTILLPSLPDIKFSLPEKELDLYRKKNCAVHVKVLGLDREQIEEEDTFSYLLLPPMFYARLSLEDNEIIPSIEQNYEKFSLFNYWGKLLINKDLDNDKKIDDASWYFLTKEQNRTREPLLIDNISLCHLNKNLDFKKNYRYKFQIKKGY